MAKYRVIGNMTGNSMDAIDLVLTEFDEDKMVDICTYSKPYTKDMQEKMEQLRGLVFDKTRDEIENIPLFHEVHDTYIAGLAQCIHEMCSYYKIDKATVNAIGFHGKTLDHNPPSKARREGSKPYTLQMGSGQMLADLTNIPVVYDFRSDFLMAGYDGAPLAGPHNAHIAAIEGDGIYYNGGNTSNFAVVADGKAVISSDAGPFNEYVDNFVRKHTMLAFDENGAIGKKGEVNFSLLQNLYDWGKDFYNTPLPKSGDPAFYLKKEIFEYVEAQKISFSDAVRTFEYFAAYIAAHALTLISEKIKLPKRIILFGGGWKNPLVRKDFETLLKGNEVLKEHETVFARLKERLAGVPEIVFSSYGTYMEARLMADLARFKLENSPWQLPEVQTAGKAIVAGVISQPQRGRKYDDKINRAAKGWQNKFKI